MIYAIIIISLLAIVPDLYIWSTFIKGSRLLWNILYWLPTLALVLLPLIALAGKWHLELFRVFICLLLLTVIPKVIFLLCSLAGKILSMAWPASFCIGNVIGLVAGIAVMLAAGYGMTMGWKRVVVKEVCIRSGKIPLAFDGYTIVQLSDFHIGTYSDAPQTVERIVKQVNEVHPDAVFFTGDLVNLSPDEVTMFMHVLAKIEAKDGVYAILGNHDYCEYRTYTAPDSPAKSLAKLIKKEEDMGWTVLRNEYRLLHRGDDSIAIIGVENDGEPPFPSRADLRKACKGLGDDIYKILLSHDPSHWRRNVLPETDIHLTLSGHTHAMQLKIGNFSPSQWKYPEWGGLYREGAQLLHVSTGVGSNVAFRFGAWPEINVIKLQATK